MASLTRGHVIVPESRSTVFEAVLEVCDELNAKIEDVNESSYQIKGKSPTSISDVYSPVVSL